MGAAPSSRREERPSGSGRGDRTKPPVSGPAAAKEEPRRSRGAPHNYGAIAADADDPSSADESIHSGIYLKNRTKKYWVDEESGCNCFVLFARALSITWSEDPRFWRWCSSKDTATSEVEVEVAALQNVCWLEVHGDFGPADLTPGATYEVAFLVRLDDPAYGWEVPVVLRLTGGGAVQTREERLLDRPKGRWIELVAGTLTAPAAGSSDELLQFSMFEYQGGAWKRGLLVKGVLLRPTH